MYLSETQSCQLFQRCTIFGKVTDSDLFRKKEKTIGTLYIPLATRIDKNNLLAAASKLPFAYYNPQIIRCSIKLFLARQFCSFIFIIFFLLSIIQIFLQIIVKRFRHPAGVKNILDRTNLPTRPVPAATSKTFMCFRWSSSGQIFAMASAANRGPLYLSSLKS